MQRLAVFYHVEWNQEYQCLHSFYFLYGISPSPYHYQSKSVKLVPRKILTLGLQGLRANKNRIFVAREDLDQFNKSKTRPSSFQTR